ncbi:aminotransferase class V-fold PLP-dependent enzyme [Solicola gregarius]|uniref:Aminotransferase class V-fold PLP-dependent enzyme n=1 Tax=Solicola gregarius TaxID=2908642 RepID=A0AA46TKC1_9ACTN|nr:aminotransferase class V-fold PLP-dependent enzyme [Solicola gregarius]UYM06865.1 aminotransferase class V-fold PLP-dependent enzyme [Solicola gregarius]
MTANRRQVIKTMGALPIAAAVPAAGMLSASAAEATAAPHAGALGGRDLFAEVGIEPLINARGTMTYLSGNLMLPEVVDAIRATSHEFVNMYELQDAVGAKLAELLDCEAAMVTAGAASALAIGTAAVLTGTDEEKIKALPFLPGPRREVVIQKSHRYVFDQNVRMAGVDFVEVEGPREMERAINDKTVMGLFFNAASSWYGTPDSVSREQFVEIAKRHKIPTFIDAAADVPPMERLFEYQRMGFDLVTFSGGKIIRGPQSAGILLGRRDLIEAAKLNFSPYEAPIGRTMKVNKEEIFGMYAAIKSYLERDHDREWDDWVDRTERIARAVRRVPTVEAEMVVPPGPANEFPGLEVTWDQDTVQISPDEVIERLRDGRPRIEVAGGGDTLGIAVVTLRADQVQIVARRVHRMLADAARG